MTNALLVTGGAGYIGSHVLIALVHAGFRPIVLDNFCNSSLESIRRVERIVKSSITVVRGDVRDSNLLDKLFQQTSISGCSIGGVIHLAGLKAVGESVTKPVTYYNNNVTGTIHLLEAMDRASVGNIVFSSSATIYGPPERLPYTEDHHVAPVNPYGQSKAMCEQILRDWSACGGNRHAVALRYFNPIGADASGLIGEDPRDIPNNLFPYVTQVAIGRRKVLTIHGDDYDTPDGTGVRDYIHVSDLAMGHVKAVQFAKRQSGFSAINLGTGRGTSVIELVKTFERATGRRVPYEVGPRRAGDVAAAWADASLAQTLLGWSAERTINDMCTDGWRWQSANPRGYEKSDTSSD